MKASSSSTEPARPLVLGVDHSLDDRRWCYRASDDGLIRELCQRHGFDDALARIVAGRDTGIAALGPAGLDPKLRDLMPDPSTLVDMEKAAARFVQAIRDKQQIAVFGDYDVDGATSTSVLVHFCRDLGHEALTHIPDRMAEGYGPNIPAMEKLKAAGADLVITVDCGTLAYEPLSKAAELGMDLLVLDHHIAEPTLPTCHALVNPNRLDDTSGQGHLAAVGVTFLFCVAVRRALEQAGWFAETGHDTPDLMKLLDLVALGTVADVVPLQGLNRAFVVQGLKVMAARRNQGLVALSDVARLDETPTPYHLGFVFGPRVNAGGRVGEASLGTQLLTETDPIKAEEMAKALDLYNRERKTIEAQVQEQAIDYAAQTYVGNQADAPIIIAQGAGWHPGVIGIVASRLKEAWRRPSFVLAVGDDGLAKGSGRSVPGVDLGSAVTAASEAGLLVNGGGHAMAAGLTVAVDKIPAMQEFLETRLAPQVRALGTAHELGVDAVLSAGAASREFLDKIAGAGPFGQGNPEPRFVLANMQISFAKPVGDGSHIRFSARDKDGTGKIDGIAFRVSETPLGEALLARKTALHLAGHLRINRYNGRESVQLVLEDAVSAAG